MMSNLVCVCVGDGGWELVLEKKDWKVGLDQSIEGCG